MKTPKKGPIDQVKQVTSPENRFTMDRRSFVFNVFLAFGAAAIAPASIAKAEEPRYEDPYYSRMKGDLKGEFVKQESIENIATAEGLSEREIEIMDKSMHVLLKHCMYLDFWGHLAGKGKEEEYKKALLTAVQNNDQLYYDESGGLITVKFYIKELETEVVIEDFGMVEKEVEVGEGKKEKKMVPTITERKEKRTATVIEKRSEEKTGEPMVIQIDGNKIIRINDTEIDYTYIQDFEKQWEKIQRKIEVISGKIVKLMNMDLLGLSKPPIISDAEWQWYSKLSYELPRTLLALAKAQGQGGHSNIIQLERRLKEHPEELDDGKDPQILISRLPKSDPEATPPRAIEILDWKTLDIIARFSIDGFVLNENGERENAGETPFADAYTKSH